MAKRGFTMAQRIKGARKALRNRRTPKGLKAYLRKFLKSHA